MSYRLNLSDLKQAMLEASSDLRENREYLNDLDSAIGDSDHGDSIDFVFKSVAEAVEQYDDESHDPGAFLRSIGRSITLSGGAAMGPLYGAGLLAAGKAIQGTTTIDAEGFVRMWQAFASGIEERGGVKRGEKTMFDTIKPAVEALESAHAAGKAFSDCAEAMLTAAEEGMQSTKEMRSLRGRSSRLGERSIGHVDPGAASMNIFLHSFIGSILEQEDI